MTLPRFTTREKIAALILVAITSVYLGAMAGNVLPHGADKVHQSRPLTPTSFRLLPPLRVDAPTLPVNR